MNIPFKTDTLNNGIKIVYIPRKDNNITCVSIFCRVGSVDETYELQGVSHFLEHMLFKGTDERPKPKDIAGELDEVGAYFNAYTDKNVTSYIVKVNSDYAHRGFNILSDMIVNSKIRSKDMITEKNVVVEEINKSKDNPSEYIEELHYQLLFGKNPLGHSIGGEESKILAYPPKKVKDYYHQYYSSNNITIATSSNLNFGDIKKLINNSYFPQLHSKNVKHTYPRLSKQLKPRIKVEHKDLEQLHLNIGFPVCNMYHRDRYVLDIVKIILAGNMSSRLFLDMREKHGLSYSVSVDFSTYESGGHFSVKTSFDKHSLFIKDQKNPGSLENITKKLLQTKPGGLTIILNNLKKLCKDLVSKEDLLKAKGFINGHLVIEKEDSHSITDYFGRQVVQEYSPIVNFGYLLDQYSKITTEMIRNTCQKYFEMKRLNITIMGEYSEKNIYSFIQKFFN